jgi:threonine dehydratase
LGDITFAHIRRFVDDIVTVSEEEIREAVRRLSVNPKLAAEPSGAVAVAAFLFHRSELPQTTRNVAILSGGNIDPALLREIQNEEPMRVH